MGARHAFRQKNLGHHTRHNDPDLFTPKLLQRKNNGIINVVRTKERSKVPEIPLLLSPCTCAVVFVVDGF